MYRAASAACGRARRSCGRELPGAGSSMLDVEFAQLSDVGTVREHNEDYLGFALPATPEQVRTHGWLFALAMEWGARIG